MPAENVERAPTGIEGFDEICGGGLVRDNTYLLAGTAGCGKTLFGLQFLYNGASIERSLLGLRRRWRLRVSALREDE